MDLSGTAWLVLQRPATFQIDADGPLIEVPGQFVNYRSDTGAPLGIVGRRYEIFQNRVCFEFLQDLVDNYDVTWETAGALRGGAKVFCCIRLPIDVRIDAEGVNDEIRPYVVSINSHDGSGKMDNVATPWRPRCANTERLAVAGAHTRWGMRHVGDPLERIAEARRTMRLSIAYYEQFKIEEEALARTQLEIDKFHEVMGELWTAPDEDSPARTHTRWNNRKETLTELFDENAKQLGRTAYAAERTFTEFLDWKAEVRPGGNLRGATSGVVRATAALEGTRDDAKSKVHRQLLLRTNS
ncbi:DUF932 domain-containing protein [Plantactinospora sp. S1510]|uniref:DUF932 domain-containing protein n=1 Tax=Plantactinospora alkalitolerans TaxID=2789879 RepID=A0ABS0HAE8_9ACTN|nr:DUF932 domain-containing protein [Plantactinospora alkalitolerans]